MSSKEKRPKPEVSTKSTFQRMLDLENKGKLSRMQALTTPLQVTRSRTSLVPTPSPSPSRISSLQSTGRAMSTPSLSLNVPRPKSRTKYLVKDGDAVPEEETEEEEGTDTSSICHSPGWDDLMGSKRKKEKKEAKARKKEIEKAEAKALAKARTEAKYAEKLKSRLTKAATPPTSKRLSKMEIVMDRSKSAPVFSNPIEPMDQLNEESDISGDSARRGSVEVGLKSFIQATQAIPVTWRSAYGTPTETTPTEILPAQEVPVPYLRPTPTQDGFIGGLKLRLADQATTQERIRARSIVEEKKVKPVPRTDHPPKLPSLGKPNNHASSPNEGAGVDALKISNEELVRTPQQWESIYEQAARMMRSPEPSQKPTQETSLLDHNIKKTCNKTYPPTSYFPVNGEGSRSRRNSSASSNAQTASRPRSSEDKDNSRGRASSAFSSEPPSNTRDTAVERGISTERGRVFRGYIGRQRKQSADRAVSGSEDENLVLGASEGCAESSSRSRRISWTSIKSFTRNSSRDAPSNIKTTRRLSKNAAAAKQDRMTPVTDEHTLPTLESGGQVPTTPSEEGLMHQRASSKGAIPSLKGFKSTGKSTFSKNHSVVTSRTGIVSNPIEIQSTNVGQYRLKQIPSKVALDSDGKLLSKAERFFGQPVSTNFYEDPLDPRPNTSGLLSNDPIPAISQAMKGSDVVERALRKPGPMVKSNKESSHSRSATDSSEEYSFFDESSNVTTPMASKPNSQKDYLSHVREDDLVIEIVGKSKTAHNPAALITHVIPPKPLEEHKRSLNTMSLSSQLSLRVSSLLSPLDPVQTSASTFIDSNRQPSLSRSMSTPEFQQDLCFLPALKHQALTKPAGEKEYKKRKGKRSPLSQAQEPDKGKPTSLIRQEPLPPTLTKSEGSSPISPVSSQYLQDARLSLPRPPPESGILSPTPGSPDPIAKMFVVCCSCKYYHDMPSKIYECMARSESVVEDKALGVSGLVSTSVRCPWCNHGMTTACCAGYAAVVVLREKLH